MSVVPFVVILRGALGAGKATVAPALAERLSALRISLDDVLSTHGLDQVEEERIPLRNFVRANALAMPAARQALSDGRPVIFDGSFYYEEQIDHLVDSLLQTSDLEGPPIIVTLSTRLEIYLVPEGEGEAPDKTEVATVVHDPALQAEAGAPVDAVERLVAQVLAALAPYLPVEMAEP
ncbi:MAG: AAA family ATPase [Anaerolineae bacterium]|nr:AAA family ATPase [Anaerolineae bacterium]